jgi:hypothetical protein
LYTVESEPPLLSYSTWKMDDFGYLTSKLWAFLCIDSCRGVGSIRSRFDSRTGSETFTQSESALAFDKAIRISDARASLIGFTSELAMTGRGREYEIRETCSLGTAIGEDGMFGGAALKMQRE